MLCQQPENYETWRSGARKMSDPVCIEISQIHFFFFFKVDNPVSILTQEMSKHFLHSKGEGDKYKVSFIYFLLSFLMSKGDITKQTTIDWQSN